MFIYDNTVVIDSSFPVLLFYCPWLGKGEYMNSQYFIIWYFSSPDNEYLIRCESDTFVANIDFEI